MPGHGADGSRKLSEEKVRAIRARVASGETKKSVARDFRIDPALVRGIVARRYYGDVA